MPRNLIGKDVASSRVDATEPATRLFEDDNAQSRVAVEGGRLLAAELNSAAGVGRRLRPIEEPKSYSNSRMQRPNVRLSLLSKENAISNYPAGRHIAPSSDRLIS